MRSYAMFSTLMPITWSTFGYGNNICNTDAPEGESVDPLLQWYNDYKITKRFVVFDPRVYVI